MKAKSIIEKLTLGLNLLKKDPKQFKKLDFPRGTYEEFVFWVESYLNACKAHPDATIEVSR